MKKNNAWLISAKSNLHVGNENTSSYGLIDKAIQRDALTGLPCINSSSLKGSLNEWASQAAQMDPKDRIKIFGVDKLGKSKETQKGAYTFFDANILLLPIQNDTTLYHFATCPAVLDGFITRMKLFGKKYTRNSLKALLEEKGYKYVEESNYKFNELCHDDNLPIIARNVLENGMSKNLWYEQILPQETVFYTLTLGEENGELEQKLTDSSELVQIGANATIGYGYCKFIKLD